jgi:uncharacterized damage-inducible protein DinB
MPVYSNPSFSTETDAFLHSSAVLEQLGGRDPIAVLEALPVALANEITGLSVEELRRPEAPGKWSMIEVIQHLADAELVWAYRLRLILSEDRPVLTGYSQDEWALSLNYSEALLDEAFDQIRIFRAANLRLLRSLSEEQLQRVGIHEERGPETIEHMISLYAGHDLVHRRQLSRIRTRIR